MKNRKTKRYPPKDPFQEMSHATSSWEDDRETHADDLGSLEDVEDSIDDTNVYPVSELSTWFQNEDDQMRHAIAVSVATHDEERRRKLIANRN